MTAEEFTRVFNQHHRGLCRFLEALMEGRRHLAEEIAQESFLRLYQTDGAVRKGDERFWLYHVARNLALNKIEKRVTRMRLLGRVTDLFQRSEPTPEAKLEQEERKRLLGSLLQDLPEPQRAALLLREHQEMSYREIAGVLGVSESKVKTDIFRARKALHTRWQEMQTLLRR